MKKRTAIWLGISAVFVISIWLSPTFFKRAIIYNFVDIDDYHLFHNRTVQTGEKVPWPESTQYNKAQISKTMLDTLSQYKTTAFLLIRNDSILSETYWDDFDTASISNSFSMAKSIIAMLIGIAIDEGKIKSLDEPVKDFIPNLVNHTNTPLTIRHLLSMSSGSNWDESYISPFSMTTQAYYGTDLPKLVSKIQIVETPGINFSYQSGNTQMLAQILKTATNQNISNYVSEKIWQKCGAQNPAFWSLDKKAGTEKAYCCFNSNARDFARIGAIVLHNGYFNHTQIISKKLLDEMTTPDTWLKGKKDKQPVNYYGLHWWIVNYHGQKIPYARGILGQYIFVLRNQNAILVRLGHRRSRTYINHHPSEIYTYLSLAMNLLKN